MRGAAGRVAAIAAFTVREALHGRGFLAAALASLAWLAVPAILGAVFWANLAEFGRQSGIGEAIAREVTARIVLGTALGGLSFVAILVAVFLGADTISGEIARGTILALAARPVERAEIVVGKTVGLALPTVALLTVLGLASTAVVGALTGVWIPEALPALALLDLELAIMVVVAVAASSRFSRTAATVLVLVSYFGVTNLAQLFALGRALGNEWLQEAATWGRLLLPVGEVSDLAGRLLAGPLTQLTESLVRGITEGFEPRPWVVGYAVVFLLGTLAVGCLALTRRDLR